MSDSPSPALQELIDRAAIEDVLTSYPRAIDRLDVELLKTLYHPDAEDDHGKFKGTIEDFCNDCIEWLRTTFTTTMHHCTHINIELHGDFAASETYYDAYHHLEGDFDEVASFFGRTYAERCKGDGTLDDGHEFTCGGRYVDLFKRRDGVWRIAHREITVEWKHFHPVTHGDPGSDITTIDAPPGRDRDDLVYRFYERARQASTAK